MTTAFPADDFVAWDYVILAERALPCLRDVPRAKTGRKLDARSAPGSSGGRVVDKGYDLAKVSVAVWLWTRDHFRTWDEIVRVIKPREGRARDAVAIGHPVLEALGIESMVVESIGALEPAGAQMFKASVEGFEFRPPTPRRASGSGAGETQVPAAPPVGAILETQHNGTLGPGQVLPPAPVSPRTRNRNP